MINYNFLLITIFFSSLYCLSFVLAKKNIISFVLHKRIWNGLLAGSFLGSGLLGLILAFCIEYNLSIAWYSKMLWYHVELGIIMTLIAIFHFLWHLKYFFPPSNSR